ncbi:DUF6118 family protein [Methylobacterium nonmethylotrophicum]|uniref:Uncharacterized protein n=1 Tax=Methylobacterium nonmethylotrophicum TaxID=1141884 RepID=A0A4Z0NCP7_9HYPH|nr:DUF6118 family protein [Methylobacterium nonmethylotrophicum]TGD92271.1 hypothetical protein EU555_34995 [Methylobacterium nonmethylotrophicum]
MTDAIDQEDEDGAARAFEALRSEVSVLRRAVEALPRAIEEVRAPDYGPTLGAIAQALSGLEEGLSAIEAHPAVKLTPESYARAIERAGAGIMREASRALRDETDAVGRERHQLAAIVGQAATQELQSRQRIRFGIGGLAIGLVLFPCLSAFMPGGSYLAALAMGTTDRWQAGGQLMQAADPAGSRGLATASRLVNANTEALQACAEAARKTGQGQKCTINVSVPER